MTTIMPLIQELNGAINTKNYIMPTIQQLKLLLSIVSNLHALTPNKMLSCPRRWATIYQVNPLLSQII